MLMQTRIGFLVSFESATASSHVRWNLTSTGRCQSSAVGAGQPPPEGNVVGRVAAPGAWARAAGAASVAARTTIGAARLERWRVMGAPIRPNASLREARLGGARRLTVS